MLVNCKKNSVVRRSIGADPVIVYAAKEPVGIYVFNQNVVPPPLELYTGWPGLTCMPEDFPDEIILNMLVNAFPEANGSNLLRLEDHIRHEPVTLICKCDKLKAGEILSRLQPVKEGLRIEKARIYRNHNATILPALNGGQWNVCMKCPYFSLEGRVGRCTKRWTCKWGVSPAEKKWDVDKKAVYFHSQCHLIERHFRFEAAFLCYTERFKSDVQKEQNPEYFFAERERLLRRDLAAAACASNFGRIRRRCSELGITFAEFAAQYDVFTQMLNFWQINRRLVENVRLLQEEGLVIPEEWRATLLALSGENESIRQELHQLLSENINQLNTLT